MIEEWLESRATVIDTQDALREARDALAAGRTDAAFALYRLLLASDTSLPDGAAAHLDALLGLAVCHARRREWTEALIPLGELCDQAPTFAPAWAYLGAARFELGEIDTACSNLDTAVACDPNDAVARLKRAEVRLSLGLLEGAEEDLRVATRASTPDEATRQYARDLLMTVMRRQQRAVARTVASPGDALRGLLRIARSFARHD